MRFKILREGKRSNECGQWACGAKDGQEEDAKAERERLWEVVAWVKGGVRAKAQSVSGQWGHQWE